MKHHHLASSLCVLIALGCESSAQSLPAGATVRMDANVQRNVEYARPDGLPLQLDIAIPITKDPAPLVVYIHGGGWRSGSKDRPLGTALVKQGYALASINYRLTDVAPFPAQLHDCKAAIRFLRANAAKYHIDPDRIAVWGTSAGGHLASLLGTTGDVKELEGDLGNPGVSSRVSAVVDFCGPTDLTGLTNQFKDLPPKERADATEMVTALLRGTIEEKADLAKQASPVTHVTPDDAPHFIVHGERDTLVPLKQSQALDAALRKAHVETTLTEVPGYGHNVPAALKDKPELAAAVKAFLDAHLKSPATQPASR